MRRKGEEVVYTGGTFDCLHVGHVELIQRCARLGRVVVALNTDEFIERYKGQKPLFNYSERESQLRRLEEVSEVIPNEYGEDSRPTIEVVNPDYIAIGSDWAEKDYYSQMGFDQKWLDERDIALIYIPRPGDISTTEIKRRINEY